MPKLTFSVNKEDENKKEIRNTGTLSVTKKTIKPSEIPNTTSTKVNPDTEIQISVNTVEDISAWFINSIGEKVFENVKNNEYLQLPYTENENLNTKDWLAKALKTLFSKEQIKEIGNQISQGNKNTGKLQEKEEQLELEKQQFEERMLKINTRFERLKEEVEEAESEKHRIEKEMQSSLSLNKLIPIFFKGEEDSPKHKQLRNLLNDAIDNADKNTGIFIAKFGKAWTILNTALNNLSEDEKENMELVHKATIEMLEQIADTHISERRPLLDMVADIISDSFNEYEFVSPEQTLQLDPAIHNAKGLGTASIKEGLSFAVIRKESRQAVKYADIIV